MKVQLSAKMQKDGTGFADGQGFAVSRGQVKEVPRMNGRIQAALRSGVLIEVQKGPRSEERGPKKEDKG